VPQGVGTSGVWGCAKNGDDELYSNVVFTQSTCGVLSSKLAGQSDVGAWNLSRAVSGREKATLYKVEGSGGLMCCRSSISLPIGSLNAGINCNDSATGVGYIMYTFEDAQSRFGADANNAEHFVCVRYDSMGGWQCMGDMFTASFAVATLDLLVARVDFDNKTVDMLKSTLPSVRVNGIATSYLRGDLEVQIDYFNGSFCIHDYMRPALC
jgi:hypothetical protein